MVAVVVAAVVVTQAAAAATFVLATAHLKAGVCARWEGQPVESAVCPV